MRACVICGLDISTKQARALVCGQRVCKNALNANRERERGARPQYRRAYARKHPEKLAAQRRAYRQNSRCKWPDERIRELGRVWAIGGLDAALAAFPGVSKQTLRARMWGSSGTRSVRDILAADNIERIQKIAVKNDRIDSTGLLDLITSRPRKAA